MSSYCPPFQGEIFEASLFHSSTSLNIKKFELNYANAGQSKKGSEGIFFYSSPENNKKAIFSAHHHARAQLIGSEHIPDEVEKYAVYECRIESHATVVDLNVSAPLKVVKSIRQFLPIWQRLKVNKKNAYSFLDNQVNGTRIEKFRSLGIDVIINYEGPDKVDGNVIVVTAPSVIQIKSSETWNINEKGRLNHIYTPDLS